MKTLFTILAFVLCLSIASFSQDTSRTGAGEAATTARGTTTSDPTREPAPAPVRAQSINIGGHSIPKIAEPVFFINRFGIGYKVQY